MSRVYHSLNPNHVVQSRQEIEGHLLAKISGNKGGKIGTELELFVSSPEGRPITFDQVEMIFEGIAAQFKGTKPAMERGRIIGLNIPDVGDVSLEPGGQMELSTKPCKDLAELEKINRIMRAAIDKAAGAFGLKVEGAGHKPAFLKAEDMPRSRFHAYYGYCRDQYGDKAQDLINTMKSCCGLQLNFDPQGDDFHEIYRALMLADVAQSLKSLTTRQKRLHETYAALSPEQLTPVFEALSARSNEELIAHTVDRLLTLKVPFVPDPGSAEGFRSTKGIFGHAPTVGELLKAGKLTTEILDNALSLQLTMPNLRRHGVLETRAPDSMDSLGDLMQTATLYTRLAYDPAARKAFLKEFEGIDPEALKTCFLTRFEQTPTAISRFDLGGGKTAGDLVRAVMGEGQAPQATAKAAPRGPKQAFGG